MASNGLPGLIVLVIFVIGGGIFVYRKQPDADPDPEQQVQGRN
jgi:hypothetical protein